MYGYVPAIEWANGVWRPTVNATPPGAPARPPPGVPLGVNNGSSPRTSLVWHESGQPRLLTGITWTCPGMPCAAYFTWDGMHWHGAPSGMYVLEGPNLATYPVREVDLGAGPQVMGLKYTPGFGHRLARWDGTQWVVLNSTIVQEWYRVLHAFDDGTGPALYWGATVGTGASRIGSIARFRAGAWEQIGEGLQQAIVQAMATYDDGTGPALYVGVSNGVLASGQVSGGLIKWDGVRWSIVGGGVFGSGFNGVSALAVFDDGRGPALYVGGLFQSAGGVPVNNLARWDGHTWEPLGAGMRASITGLAAFDDGHGPALFVAGRSAGFGGVATTASIGMWVGCPNCYADCDLDRRLTPADFTCFMAKVAANDPYANCTVDGQIDAADYVCFISKYAAGCP
ncbi:MAG: hypothetical protein JNM80_01775 [Phycisphaerae bacterium]|nr:hypothetical protein [Phycisphaerae bacterium]